MEDVAVHVRHHDTVKCPLHRIHLVGPHGKKRRLRILDDKVFIEHLSKVELRQECICKVHQLVDARIVLVCPEKSQGLQDVLLLSEYIVLIDVGAVFCHRAVGDDEELDIPEQAAEREPPVAVDLVDCLINLDAGAFQLRLHERKPVDKDRDVITVLIQYVAFVSRIHGDLMRDLVDIPRLIVGEELDIYALPVIKVKDPFLPEDLCGLVDRMVVQAQHHAVELRIGEHRGSFCLCERFLVQFAELLPEIGTHIIVVPELYVFISQFSESLDI